MACATEFFNDPLREKSLKGHAILARGNVPGINIYGYPLRLS